MVVVRSQVGVSVFEVDTDTLHFTCSGVVRVKLDTIQDLNSDEILTSDTRFGAYPLRSHIMRCVESSYPIMVRLDEVNGSMAVHLREPDPPIGVREYIYSGKIL